MISRTRLIDAHPGPRPAGQNRSYGRRAMPPTVGVPLAKGGKQA